MIVRPRRSPPLPPVPRCPTCGGACFVETYWERQLSRRVVERVCIACGRRPPEPSDAA